MPESRKYCTPEFVFKKVLTWPYYAIYIVAVVAACPATLLYVALISRYFPYGGLAFTFGIWILLIGLILNALSKDRIIYFDQRSMYIGDKDRHFARFANNEIAGIYSYDYEKQDKSQISLTIIFKNGRKLHFTDVNLFPSQDRAKSLALRQFLTAAKRRLNLVNTSKNQWRTLNGAGGFWYSPLQHTTTDEHEIANATDNI